MDYKEKVISLLKDKELTTEQKVKLESVFPELKESKDERIRKDLYYAISRDWLLYGNNIYGIETTKQEALAWLKRQGGQKPAETPKLKFKIDDWIISNNKKSTYQVIEVKRSIYVIRDNADNHEYHIGIEECEKSGRLFTIQDAKPGDVLQLGKVTAIFKKFVDNGNCRCYCSVCDGEFEIPIENGDDNVYGCNNVIPATKKQRDLLFQKMKEAGYEWDAEKLELYKDKYNNISSCKEKLIEFIEDEFENNEELDNIYK